MASVSIQEAQIKLTDLIHQLTPGEELVITENNLPVARLVGSRGERPQPRPGSQQGVLQIVADDEEHLNDFKEYGP